MNDMKIRRVGGNRQSSHRCTPIVCGTGSGAMQPQQICPARILVPPRARFPDVCLRAESAYWRIQYSHRSAFVNLIPSFLPNCLLALWPG
jgi:hypothetical protein